MRLLHIVHQYPPDYLGGTELYTQQLATAQAAAGADVHVFYRRDKVGPALERREGQSGVHVWAASSRQVTPGTRFRATFGDRDLKRSLNDAVVTIQPDLVHIQHLMGLPASAHRALGHAPRVVTLHDYWWVCANAQLLTNYDGSLCDGPLAWINCARCALARAGHARLWPAAPLLAPALAWRSLLLAPVWRQAALLIAPTHFVRDWYADHGLPGERLRVVPHGITVPETLPARQANPGGPLRVGYVGGLAPQKGVHVLVNAVADLSADQIKLSVLGDLKTHPGYARALQAAGNRANITFMGRVDRSQLWQALVNLDVLVVPSLWYETAALVIQEAHAAGVPVVASNLGALAERVRHEIDGLLVPPGDSVALRNVLAALHADRAWLARLAAGIRPARTIDQHVRDIEDIYREILT